MGLLRFTSVSLVMTCRFQIFKLGSIKEIFMISYESMNEYFIYMITNEYNTTLYIGVTNNLVRRIYEHKNKLVKGFSQKYNLSKLIYFKNTEDIKSAILREKQLKKYSRAKKEQLIYTFNKNKRDLYNDII